MLIIVLVVLGLAAAVLVAVVAMQPSNFNVSRSATVAASPADVFARVQDLHQWESWSPWEKIDPAMKRVYEGPQTGTGSVYRWAGNGKVGQGSMTITETAPNQLVRLRLDFLKPFKGTNIAEFTFKPDGERTL